MGNYVGGLPVDYGIRAGRKPALKPYTKLFDDVFPFYISIGMTEQQFWDGDAELVVAYRKAHELKQKRDNEHLWLQGLYFYEALCDAAPLFRDLIKGTVKAHPYCEEPKPLTKLELREYKEKKAKEASERIKKHIHTVIAKMSRSDNNGGSSN